MRDVSPQLEMLPGRALTLSVEAQEEIASTCNNKHEALVKCFINSGLTPQQVYPFLGPMNSGTPEGRSQGWFSKFLSGDALLNPKYDEELRLMRICKNLIPQRYDAAQTKHALMPIVTGLEAKLAEEREGRLEAERRNRYLEELLMGRRA